MKKSSMFWVGYSDLISILFFVMLVLFVLAIGYLKFQKDATEEQLNQIMEIQTAVKELPKEYFAFDSLNRRFTLVKLDPITQKTVPVFINFDTGQDKIKPEYVDYLVNVGKSIKDRISELKLKYAKYDIKYLVIIEGMASQDSYSDNFPLSYKRARAVQILWENANVMPDCDVQMAGSGTGGIGRHTVSNEEKKNQRILIHIVPKIGTFKSE